MKKSALAVAMTLALTAACTSGPRSPSPEPSASSPPAGTQDATPARDKLLAIPRGPRARASWFRTGMVTLHGGERRVWLHGVHPTQFIDVAAYRGGYLATKLDSSQVRMRGTVFDAEGRRVRKLSGCMTRPAISDDGRRVAWATCAGPVWTLHVGPSRDLAMPDQAITLPDDLATNPYPVAVGDVGVAMQRADPVRGYLRGAFVIDPATGAMRNLPGVIGVESVSSQGIACVALSSGGLSLLDLATGEEVRRLRRPIRAWSPDGARGLVLADLNNGRSWDIVDTTDTVLRTIELPDELGAFEARWEDSSNLLFVVTRHAWTTILRVLPSGEIQRVSGVVSSDFEPSFL